MIFCALASKSVATIFSSLPSKPMVGSLVELQNQGGGGFSGLSLKTGSYGLLIWTSKSLRRFLVWAVKPSRLRFVVAPQN
jgi:hypothetical protein